MTSNNHNRRHRLHRAARQGAIVPLVAVFLPLLLILASISVNLSYMELTRTQLRIATDAASRAAGHKLVSTSNTEEAILAARQAGNRNPVAGEKLSLENEDIIFGVASRPSLNSRYSFTPGATPPNSVQIIGRRTDDSASGNVSLIVPMNGNLGTFQAVQSATSSQIELDIVLVLDRSGSMAYGADEDYDVVAGSGLPPASAPPGWAYCDPVPNGSRWADLTHAVEVFAAVLQQSFAQEKVGLATYGSDASLDVQLTTNYDDIIHEIDDYSETFCNSATNIGSGMVEGISAITNPSYAREGAVKVMIVMTDGRHNTGTDPLGVAYAAREEKIIVYTVTFSDDSEQQRMIDVADIGGGTHYHALQRDELIAVFEEIATGLPTLLTE